MNRNSYSTANSSYRASRSRSRQRQQKAGEMIAMNSSNSYGYSNQNGGSGGGGASSSSTGFLPAASRDGVRTPSGRNKRETSGSGGGGGEIRLSRSRQGMRNSSGGMAGAGSRALAGNVDLNNQDATNNENNRNVGTFAATQANTRKQAGSLPMIGGAANGGGGGSSEGTPAAVPAPSRRHRHRNSNSVPVHTGNPVTKTEKSVRAGCHSIEGVKPGNPNWSNQDNFFVSF